MNLIIKIKRFCLFLTAFIAVGSNTFNYFYSYKYLDDRLLQWRVAMISISLVMFLMAFYIWLNESLKKRGISIIISGWVALYLFFNLIGVLIGFDLHTKGFMIMLHLLALSGVGHLSIRLWQIYF
jgi:hypothetical protein